jgi:hypothetical protein
MYTWQGSAVVRVYTNSRTFIVKCFWQNNDEPGKVFEYNPSIAEKIQQENKNSLQSSYKVIGLGFLKDFVKMQSRIKLLQRKKYMKRGTT